MKRKPKPLTVPRGLFKSMMEVMDVNILHRQGRYPDGSWKCVPNCQACMVLAAAKKRLAGIG